jgi:hypothetical protein
MSIRRPFLKEVGQKLGELAPLELTGATRVESLHTIYRFEDGICVEVERRKDCAPIDGRLHGMRLVGWVVEVPGGRFLVPNWQQGARGVLWRTNGDHGTIAMTSRTFAFVAQPGKTEAARDGVPPSRPPMASMMRLFDQQILDQAV